MHIELLMFDVAQRDAAAFDKHTKESIVKVLLVMSPDRRKGLAEHLRLLGVETVSASDEREARHILEKGPAVGAVFVAPSVKNAGWREIRAEVRTRSAATPVVVCMGRAEPGLMDVLEGGGAFGVLVEPYRQQEVKRLLELSEAMCDREQALPAA